MAITNFVPEIWSAELLTALEKSLVYGAAVNRDYEGDIAQAGDTVHITNLVDPTIGTYVAHTDIVVEPVNDGTTSLTITQSPYFAFEVDDIEKRQARGGVLDEQARRAAYMLRDKADQYIAGLMATGAGRVLDDVTTAPAAADAYELLVDLSVALDEANVPTEGRFVVVPPKFHGLLLKDDRFIGAGDAIGAATRENGFIGEAAGLAVRKSNNVPTGDNATTPGKVIIAGSTMATTFAQQIAKVEAFKMEKRFNEAIKGLHLYGAKVVRPDALAAVEVVL